MSSSPSLPVSRPAWRTIWYMGAKTRLLDGFILDAVARLVGGTGTVVDIFTGSGAVAYALADRYRVIANDVQAYSATIARSLVEHGPDRAELLPHLDPEADLGPAFQANHAALLERFGPQLQQEHELLGAADDHLGSPDRWATGPLEEAIPPGARPISLSRSALTEAYRTYLAEATLSPAEGLPGETRPGRLMTTYYGNIYFGLAQAVALDSLRRAIRDLDGPLAPRRRTHYLSALLHAASVSTSGTSHFAQPRSTRKDRELWAVLGRRRASVVGRFLAFEQALREAIGATRYRPGNRVLNGDYRDLFQGGDGDWALPGAPPDAFYVDPPYTQDHYSRFYHVLEVLVAYDYPTLQRRGGRLLKGRYPLLEERFRAAFSSRVEVEGAFLRLFQRIAGIGSRIVLSYALQNGLLFRRWVTEEGWDGMTGREAELLDRLRALCRQSFRHVQLERKPLCHSGQGDSTLDVDEILLTGW